MNEIVELRDIHFAGMVANQVAGNHVFSDYLVRRSINTLRAHLSDLETFCAFLANAGVACPGGEALQYEPAAWTGVTCGLVQSFVKWCLTEGVAISTVNRRLSTVKTYAQLAARVGVLNGTELALIKSVAGYGYKERNRVDEKRAQTRTGHKKAQNVQISLQDAQSLKAQSETPQGRRDALLMCLLLDHGLRVGEVAALQVGDMDLKAGELKFWREKVQKQQRHRLTSDTLAALRTHTQADGLPTGYLLRSSNKSGCLTDGHMSTRAINMRVGVLGAALGINGLSPHDCRHYWATRAIQKGTEPFALKQAGGWNSMTTVSRYVDENEIANEGVIL